MELIKPYETPKLELLNVIAEQGFANSLTNDGPNDPNSVDEILDWMSGWE